MALRFDLDRHRHLAGATQARAWLTMREQFGLAPNTLDAYARAVDSYLAFLNGRERDCEGSTQSDIAGWINESRARGLANATLIQRVTALRLFFEYLVEEGLRPGNPVSRGGAFRCHGATVFRTAGPVRRAHTLPWIPTDEEWERLLGVTAEDCIRDRAMLALAYDGALRREELCSIMVGDFDFARKLLTIRAETTKNRSGSWHKGRVFISEVFRFEILGFEQVEEDFYKVHFRDVEIGEFDAGRVFASDRSR